jgi:hypothetical protein
MSEEQKAPVTQDEYRQWIAKRPSPREIARAELRDRFAGYALIGLVAAGDAHAYNRDEMAAEAWRQADAMLKARGDG